MNLGQHLIHILLDFPFQLIVAANLFAAAYPRRRWFWLRALVVYLPLLIVYDWGVMHFGYQILDNWVLDKSIMLLPAMCVFAGILLCYDCSVEKAFFCIASAFPLQNMLYNLDKLIEMWLGFAQDGIIDLCASAVMMLVVYGAAYFFFHKKLGVQGGTRRMSGRLVLNSTLIFLYVVYLYVLSSNDDPVVLVVFVSCDALAIIMQYSLLTELTSNWKYEVMEQLLYAERKKYQRLSETTEIINRKCHDLKYLVEGLRQMDDGPERRKHFDEIEQAVMIYGNAVKSGNDTLDLLLMDRMLYCEERHIKLTCVADGSLLSWMDTIDLYTLFGNALDNAIESVSGEEDESKRIISFRIGKSGQMVGIHFENYVSQQVELKNGWPVTSKADKEYHGFGLLSIRRITEKYGGSLSIRVENHMFRLNILLPQQGPDANQGKH